MGTNINKRVARSDTAARHERQNSPEIVQPTSAVRYPPAGIKVFKVQSAATGDGVYNCYEQKLLSTTWTNTNGDIKFANRNTTSIEVLNLNEYDPDPLQHYLPAGILLNAWQMIDDEGNVRWVGKVIVPWIMCGA